MGAAARAAARSLPVGRMGGKSRAAHLIWPRFGDVANYVEPFAGSLAVLLRRPHAAGNEIVNDLDCYIANTWRAIAAAPEEVARWADSPVNEADLHARHRWLHAQAEFRDRLRNDPHFYDAKVAGWWCWGLSCWIGDNWCRPNENNSTPHLTGGMGVARQVPHLTGGMADDAAAVRAWAIENGSNPLMRIALCGYDTEHGPHMPPDWTCVAWKAAGGYGNKNGGAANVNATRERIWFSPNCLRPEGELDFGA